MFRARAEKACKLVLRDAEGNAERNEEICAVCSDGGTLVMCSSCPRSFCSSCIGGVLRPEEVEQMHQVSQ
jgi:hypothetical protein